MMEARTNRRLLGFFQLRGKRQLMISMGQDIVYGDESTTDMLWKA